MIVRKMTIRGHEIENGKCEKFLENVAELLAKEDGEDDSGLS